MKVIRKMLTVAGLAGAGYAGYKVANKTKHFKEQHDVPVVFGGKDEKIQSDIVDTSYGVLFGGLSLDLSEATMATSSVTFEISGEFCGISIVVPGEWNVKVEGNAEKSGISNHCHYNEADLNSKLFIVKYDIKYGGFDIHYAQDEAETVVDVDTVDFDSEVQVEVEI